MSAILRIDVDLDELRDELIDEWNESRDELIDEWNESRDESAQVKRWIARRIDMS